MAEINETVYDHIKGRDTVTVTAGEQWSVNMVRRLKAQRPDEVEIVAENKDGSVLAHIPLSWMRIVPKRTRDMTDEKRQELSEWMKKVREKRGSAK